MNSTASINIFFTFFIVLIFTIHFPSIGQDSLIYNGTLKLGTYQGNAIYSYHINQEDTMLDGGFSFQNFNLDAHVSKAQDFFTINGTFRSGSPDSIWNFRFGNFSTEKGTELVDYHLKVKISGTQHSSIAGYQEGKPEGEWIHTVLQIDSSRVMDTIFASSSQLEAGTARGNIRIENDSLTLLGRFDRNGFAHDIWELNFNNELNRMEKWYFYNGRLAKISIEQDQISEDIIIYDNEIQGAKNINLDHRYLKILKIQNLYDSIRYEREGGKITKLIRENAAYHQKTTTILSDITGNFSETSKPEYLVKVAYYPLETEEVTQLKTLKHVLQQIDTASQLLLTNTRLNMIKYSDEEVLYLLSVLEKISQQFILPARNVITYHKEDLLAYLPRSKFHWPDSNSASLLEIPVTYQDSSGIRTRTFTGPIPENLETQKTGIPYLIDLSNYALSSVNTINNILKKKVKQYNIQKELEDQEKKLLQEEKQLINLVDSLLEVQTGAALSASLKSIKKTAITELAEYAAQEDLIDKP
ncbi:MAG: hypothetical protein ACOCXH_15715, partial [Cyclobacteriaceae bacterium]